MKCFITPPRIAYQTLQPQAPVGLLAAIGLHVQLQSQADPLELSAQLVVHVLQFAAP